jgi:hypothetical protein
MSSARGAEEGKREAEWEAEGQLMRRQGPIYASRLTADDERADRHVSVRGDGQC